MPEEISAAAFIAVLIAIGSVVLCGVQLVIARVRPEWVWGKR